MLVVLDEFSVTGMLVRRDMCTSVTVCEGANYARPLYDVIQSVCTREAMVFQKIQKLIIQIQKTLEKRKKNFQIKLCNCMELKIILNMYLFRQEKTDELMKLDTFLNLM